ncbi:RNA polymerase sigma factor [Marinomonas sp. ef1]|uniref:RNA polymerase sigma factor n=1 Tax=Marinomonas sp. ef1 TaxID=2005043 RepID=UPI000C293C59|nr:sigma-70 family RNA polymerase sigma factor [Marinomonas sp. ef1]
MFKSDLELMVLIGGGDKIAFKELKSRYDGYVKGVCKKCFETESKGLHLQMRQGYTNLIEDVVTEVWQAVYKKANSDKAIDNDNGKDESAFKKYLTVIIKNQTKKLNAQSAKNRSSDRNTFYNSNNSFVSIEDVVETDFIDNRHDFYNEHSIYLYEKEIEGLIQDLTDKDREIFSAYIKMSINEGKGQKEISNYLGISLSSYQKKIKLIKEYMKEKLNDIR